MSRGRELLIQIISSLVYAILKMEQMRSSSIFIISISDSHHVGVSLKYESVYKDFVIYVDVRLKFH